MTLYHLKIITPSGRIFDDSVESLIVPGCQGFLGILANHAPIVAEILPGRMTLRKDSEIHAYTIGGGVLEVSREEGHTLLLLDHADRCLEEM